MDFNSLTFSHWLVYTIGALFIGIGLLILILGVKTLSLHSSSGLKGTLITSGLYKYSRNPQYIGDILLFIGIILLANSFLTIITGSLGILWNILLPFTEEPWLEEIYREVYEKYKNSVRRFL